jgi:hypothetical protein
LFWKSATHFNLKLETGRRHKDKEDATATANDTNDNSNNKVGMMMMMRKKNLQPGGASENSECEDQGTQEAEVIDDTDLNMQGGSCVCKDVEPNTKQTRKKELGDQRMKS